MEIPLYISWSLLIGSGVSWTLVYILIIKRGFQDKTCGMPLVALCANISWEFIFSFVHPHGTPQLYVNIVWFGLDGVILFQLLRYGRSALRNTLPARLFYPAFFLALGLSFWAVLSITREFGDWHGKYAAFAQNFMMSVLFVVMLYQRKGIGGQSLYIAIFKMLGTVLPSVLFYLRFPSSPLLNFLYIAIFLFDGIYLVLLYRKHWELGINPWKRL